MQISAPPSGLQSKLRSNIDLAVINAFLIFWLFNISCAIMPPGPLWWNQRHMLDPFVDTFMIREYWNVFAPAFRDFNEHGQFFVDYKDGTVGMREPLRLDRLDQLTRWQHGKIREYFVDNLLVEDHNTDGSFLSVGRFVARATNMPDNPVERVTMGANWERITTDPYIKMGDLPQDDKHFSFFCHGITAEDLK